MRFVLRYFALLAAFGLGLGTIYWFFTYEVVGAVVLWCFGLMPLIVATWWWRQGTDPASLSIRVGPRGNGHRHRREGET